MPANNDTKRFWVADFRFDDVFEAAYTYDLKRETWWSAWSSRRTRVEGRPGYDLFESREQACDAIIIHLYEQIRELEESLLKVRLRKLGLLEPKK